MRKFVKKLPTSYLADGSRQSKISKEVRIRYHHGQYTSSLFPKMILRFPLFPGRVENKMCYGSMRLLNIFKNVLQIMIEVLGLYKKNVRGDRGLPHNLVFFSGRKTGCKETSNITVRGEIRTGKPLLLFSVDNSTFGVLYGQSAAILCR